MLLYHFKQAFRNLVSARPHSLLNILGLTLGLSCSLFLYKYSQFERNTDRFHEGIDDIYLATIKSTPLSQPKYITASLFFNIDYNEFPALESEAGIILYEDEQLEHNGNTVEAEVLVADSSFFDIFDFPLQVNVPEDVLHNPQNLLLKPSVAKRLFGEEDPVGKVIRLKGSQFIVAGFLAQGPKNSSLDFEVIVPYHAKSHWGRQGLEFIRLQADGDIEPINEALAHAGRDHPQFPNSHLEFVPFAGLYFDTNIVSTDILRSGNLRNVNILQIAAFLILAISLFNYVNIYLAILIRRSQDIGVKKIFGARRRELALEIVCENLWSSFLAVWLSLVLLLYFTPWLQSLAEKPIALSFPGDLASALVLTLGLTILLSIYPILRILYIDTMELLLGKFTGLQNSLFRKWVIGIQFGASILLLIASFSFQRQIHYMLNKDIGINSERIVQTNFDFQRHFKTIIRPKENTEEAMRQYQQDRDEVEAQVQSSITYTVDAIQSNPNIEDLCFGDSPLEIWEAAWKNVAGGDYHTVPGFSVTPNFRKVYGLEAVQGRFFDPEKDQSRERKVVINERAWRFFGFEDLSNARIANSSWGAEKDPFTVIGVVKDFHYQHLSHPVAPLVMFYHDDREDNNFIMRIVEGKNQEALRFLSRLYQESNPDAEFEYSYFDEEVKAMYEEDQRIATIYKLFTIVGMVISAFGLFSISLFEVQQRVKEIGIRKVNGASTLEIMALLLRRFLRIIGLAFLIACPVAWWGMNQYLENFAFRAPESSLVYFLSGMIALVIALLTLIGQTYQAAIANPVESLRRE